MTRLICLRFTLNVSFFILDSEKVDTFVRLSHLTVEVTRLYYTGKFYVASTCLNYFRLPLKKLDREAMIIGNSSAFLRKKRFDV